MQDFDNALLKGTLDGEIRQEYRELDILDIITDLQHQGVLPPIFGDGTRWGTIARYRDWLSSRGQNLDWEPFIQIELEDDTAAAT